MSGMAHALHKRPVWRAERKPSTSLTGVAAGLMARNVVA